MSPSYLLGLQCPLRRLEVAPGARGTPPEGDHLLIGLCSTG
jgi:hypothetical protein